MKKMCCLVVGIVLMSSISALAVEVNVLEEVFQNEPRRY